MDYQSRNYLAFNRGIKKPYGLSSFAVVPPRADSYGLRISDDRSSLLAGNYAISVGDLIDLEIPLETCDGLYATPPPSTLRFIREEFGTDLELPWANPRSVMDDNTDHTEVAIETTLAHVEELEIATRIDNVTQTASSSEELESLDTTVETEHFPAQINDEGTTPNPEPPTEEARVQPPRPARRTRPLPAPRSNVSRRCSVSPVTSSSPDTITDDVKSVSHAHPALLQLLTSGIQIAMRGCDGDVAFLMDAVEVFRVYQERSSVRIETDSPETRSLSPSDFEDSLERLLESHASSDDSESNPTPLTGTGDSESRCTSSDVQVTPPKNERGPQDGSSGKRIRSRHRPPRKRRKFAEETAKRPVIRPLMAQPIPCPPPSPTIPLYHALFAQRPHPFHRALASATSHHAGGDRLHRRSGGRRYSLAVTRSRVSCELSVSRKVAPIPTHRSSAQAQGVKTQPLKPREESESRKRRKRKRRRKVALTESVEPVESRETPEASEPSATEVEVPPSVENSSGRASPTKESDLVGSIVEKVDDQPSAEDETAKLPLSDETPHSNRPRIDEVDERATYGEPIVVVADSSADDGDSDAILGPLAVLAVGACCAEKLRKTRDTQMTHETITFLPQTEQ